MSFQVHLIVIQSLIFAVSVLYCASEHTAERRTHHLSQHRESAIYVCVFYFLHHTQQICTACTYDVYRDLGPYYLLYCCVCTRHTAVLDTLTAERHSRHAADAHSREYLFLNSLSLSVCMRFYRFLWMGNTVRIHYNVRSTIQKN